MLCVVVLIPQCFVSAVRCAYRQVEILLDLSVVVAALLLNVSDGFYVTLICLLGACVLVLDARVQCFSSVLSLLFCAGWLHVVMLLDCIIAVLCDQLA
jgi:hypothetical protein